MGFGGPPQLRPRFDGPPMHRFGGPPPQHRFGPQPNHGSPPNQFGGPPMYGDVRDVRDMRARGWPVGRGMLLSVRTNSSHALRENVLTPFQFLSIVFLLPLSPVL